MTASSHPRVAQGFDDALPPLAADERDADLVVIGAGIIGTAIALRIAQRDAAQGQARRILVVERQALAAGASRGNAGAFAFSDIHPLASPRILRQVPRWLLDPLGPLALRPAYLPRMAPWLWRFWRASRPARFAESTTAQAALNRLSAALTPILLKSIGAQSSWHEGGNLHLYESDDEWRASLPAWQQRAAHGIACEHAQGPGAIERIAQWQPGLSPKLVAATFVPRWATIDDPQRLVERYAAAAQIAGVRVRRAAVERVLQGAQAVELMLADGSVLRAGRVVIAAGAWSHRLAASLGDRIPLETERGYNTTLPASAFELQRQLTFPGHGFVVTPTGGGVRVGGAVEFAGLEAAPDYRRSAALLAKAKRFLPGLRTEGGTAWMGCRPSLPDSLPVIGAAPGDARVVYAFGHGHLGLTQSAATAELVTQLLAGETPALDLAPFSPRRWS